jgi:hypothetical protein
MEGNQMNIYLQEYVQRRTLAKIGFTSNIDELSQFKQDIFLIIADEFATIDEQELKKSGK